MGTIKKMGAGFFVILTIGFSCLWASGLTMVQYDNVLPDTIYYINRMSEIICFIIAAIIIYRTNCNIETLIISTFIFFIIYLLVELSGIFFTSISLISVTLPFDFAACLFSGCLNACILLLIVWLLFSTPFYTVLTIVSASIAFAHIIHLLLDLFPNSISTWFKIICLIIATVSIYLLINYKKHYISDNEYYESVVINTINTHSSTKSIHFTLSTNSLSLLLGIIIFPLLYGLMSQICAIADINSGLFDTATELVGIAFLLVCSVGSLLWKGRFDAETIFYIMLPIFATSLLFLPIFWQNEIFVSGFIMKCGYLIYTALMWAALHRITQDNRRIALLAFSIALAMYYSMILIGRLIALALNSQLSFSPMTISVIALTLIWVLSIMALIVILISKYQQKKIAKANPTFDDKLSIFANMYNLSEREYTICREYARGRTIEYISKMLNVSQETVKTHLKRMYAKTSCHSRQDLISTIDSLQEQENSFSNKK